MINSVDADYTMRRNVRQIVVAAIATVLSLSCYIAPYPSILLPYDQMNEILLAVFGAGISILATELIEYRYLCNRLEKNILLKAERVISSFQGMRTAIYEPLPDVSTEETYRMLRAYYDEEWGNCHPFLPGTCRHDARNKLIALIERCTPDEYDRIAADISSSFNRFLSRTQKTIYKAYESYQFCFDGDIESFSSLLSDIDSISYLPVRCFWRGCPLRLSNRDKKDALDDMRSIIETARSELKDAVGACRLFKEGDYPISNLLETLHDAEKNWDISKSRQYDCKFFEVGNIYAIKLFDATAKFAKYTSAQEAQHYSAAPWWAIERKPNGGCTQK